MGNIIFVWQSFKIVELCYLRIFYGVFVSLSDYYNGYSIAVLWVYTEEIITSDYDIMVEVLWYTFSKNKQAHIYDLDELL